MRISFSIAGSLIVVGILASGCAGPEQKFGRGLSNAVEFARLGEIRRSMEQTALWEGPGASYATGVIRGVNRSIGRTAVGVYEMVTAPFPSYDPIFMPENAVYPDSYAPRILADPMFQPDSVLGFNGGDVAPFIPGSRFRIWDY